MNPVSTAETFWWVLAGIAVLAELATGTFYLLVVAVGLAAGGACAHFGQGPATQCLVAAVIGSGSALALRGWRRGHPAALPAAMNRDVNLDVGESIRVARWSDDGTARVLYRGTEWNARSAAGAPPREGEHRIVAVDGNWLVVAPSEARTT